MTLFSILIVAFSFFSTVSFVAVMISVMRSGQISRIEEKRGLVGKMYSKYPVNSINIAPQPKNQTRFN